MERMKPAACPNYSFTPTQLGAGGNIPAGTYTGQYVISNNVTVGTGTVKFVDAEVLVDPDVEITILPLSDVYVDHSHFFGCAYMWDGFNIQNRGRFHVINNSMVEDAKIAVRMEMPLNVPISLIFEARNSIFNKNNEGVVAANFPGNVGPITGCVFTCRDIPALKPYNTDVTVVKAPTNPISSNLQSPYIDDTHYPYVPMLPTTAGQGGFLDYPFRAIGLLRVGTTTGANLTNNTPNTPTFFETLIGNDKPADYNVIDLHQYGIDAYNSNFTCHNTVFQNLRWEMNGIRDYGKGVGVRAYAAETPDHFRFRILPASDPNGMIDGTHNRFYDCKTGIHTRDYLEAHVIRACFRSTQSTTQPSMQDSPGEFGFWSGSNRMNHYEIRTDSFFNIAQAVNLFLVQHPVAMGPGGQTIDQYVNSVRISENIIQPIVDMQNGSIGTEYVHHGIRANRIGNQSSTFTSLGPNMHVYVGGNSIQRASNGIDEQNWVEMLNFVEGNYVSLSPDPWGILPQYGIQFIDNYGQYQTYYRHVTNNYVQGFDPYAPDVRGIFCANNYEPQITCNPIENVQTGLHFNDPNVGVPGHQVLNNTLQNCNWGFVLNNNAIIGTQGGPSQASDNRWVGGAWAAPDYNTVVIDSDPAFSALYVLQGVFEYDPDGSGLFMGASPYPYAFSFATLNAALPSYSLQCPTPPVASRTQDTTETAATPELWLRIMGDSLPYYGDTAAARFLTEYRLYELLRMRSAWQDTDPALAAYCQQRHAGWYGKLYALARADSAGCDSLRQTFTDAPTLVQAYAAYYGLLHKAGGNGWTPADSAGLAALGLGCAEQLGDVPNRARQLYQYRYRKPLSCSLSCYGQGSQKLPAAKPTLSLYPNPNGAGKVYVGGIRAEDAPDWQVRIFNHNGQQLGAPKLRTDGKQPSFDSQTLTPGLYFIQLSNSQTHENHTLKLIAR